MTSAPSTGTRLARKLRDLREHEWPDAELTQVQLAKALGAENRSVAAPTLSSWESLTHPKTPTAARLSAYARFFCTRRSLAGEPHLIPLVDLDEDEIERFHHLEARLMALLDDSDEAPAETERRRALLNFGDVGPVVIICPEPPADSRGPLASETSPNFTRLHQYADLDALIEVFGHIRAQNPTASVLHRLPSTVRSEELSCHVVLVGGVGWNKTTRRFLAQLGQLPIEQFEHEGLDTGEVFRVKKGDGREEEQAYFPTMETSDGVTELVEDVALLARLPNPFNSNRTLTIFNGVHSRGVMGAVLAVTDETVRPANEEYLAQHFPSGAFAILVRVPVMSGNALAPDLKNREARLFEWQPMETD